MTSNPDRIHDYDPNCNCEPCFVVWRAGAAIEQGLARERGEQRRQAREAMWAEMLAHFTKRLPPERTQ